MGNVGGEEVERFGTTMTSRDGAITKYPWQCPHFTQEGDVVQSKPRDLYALVDHVELVEKNRDGFACCRLPQHVGNMNGWLSKDERELGWNGVDSDLESTASSQLN